MKKFVRYFLALCAFIAVQILAGSVVNALPAIDYSSPPVAAQDNKEQFPIPKLSKLEQISPNQIQISFDRDVDLKLATKATNYWVQDEMNENPKGIATVGKNTMISVRNSLTSKMVKIEPKNGSASAFILTFSKEIPRGSEYRLVICYVTVPGAPAYTGDNGRLNFVGREARPY